MKRLSTFDFTELEHYVDGLERSDDKAERVRYKECIAAIARELPEPKKAGMLVLRASRFAAWGGPFAAVREEFTKVVVAYSGAAGASLHKAEHKAEQRRVSVAHGHKGGRPPSGHDKEWFRLFNTMKSKNKILSDTEVCRRIAATWTDERDRRRSLRTILEGVRREQNKS